MITTCLDSCPSPRDAIVIVMSIRSVAITGLGRSSYELVRNSRLEPIGARVLPSWQCQRNCAHDGRARGGTIRMVKVFDVPPARGAFARATPPTALDSPRRPVRRWQTTLYWRAERMIARGGQFSQRFTPRSEAFTLNEGESR